MRIRFILASAALLTAAGGATRTPVIVNEFNADSGAMYRNGGTEAARSRSRGVPSAAAPRRCSRSRSRRCGATCARARSSPWPGTFRTLINVQASSAASGQFISATDFSVSNEDTQITVLDPLAQVWFGPAGEGIQPTTGINNREVRKLETNPSDAITPTSGYDDGSSSSFGAPNRWRGGANVQDFSALRAVVVPEPGALARASVRARRAA